jgi:hypothetical protein
LFASVLLTFVFLIAWWQPGRTVPRMLALQCLAKLDKDGRHDLMDNPPMMVVPKCGGGVDG